MASLVDFTINKNKPRVPRERTTLADLSLRKGPNVSVAQLLQYAAAFLEDKNGDPTPDPVNIKIARSCVADALLQLNRLAGQRS